MAGYTHNTNDITPTMTANNAPVPYVAAASSEYSASYKAYKAFDGSASSTNAWVSAASGSPWWVSLDFGSAQYVVISYSITIYNSTNEGPKDFKFQGSNNGSAWDDLDSRTGITWSAIYAMQEFSCTNLTKYRYYRLYVTAVGSGNYCSIYEIEMMAVSFVFSDPFPVHLSTIYEDSTLLKIKVTTSGTPGVVYNHDVAFYDVYNNKIGSTVSGISSGDLTTSTDYYLTPSSGTYQWYAYSTVSGQDATSSMYSFDRWFLCSGYTEVSGTRASGIQVRLYRRVDGSYIGGATTTGVSGTFSIETPYDEYHYCVALYSGIGTNALIYDYLKP